MSSGLVRKHTILSMNIGALSLYKDTNSLGCLNVPFNGVVERGL